MTRNTVFSGLAAFFDTVGRARNAAQTYAKLSAMSDRALAARGIDRSDLASVAYKKAFGG